MIESPFHILPNATSPFLTVNEVIASMSCPAQMLILYIKGQNWTFPFKIISQNMQQYSTGMGSLTHSVSVEHNAS